MLRRNKSRDSANKSGGFHPNRLARHESRDPSRRMRAKLRAEDYVAQRVGSLARALRVIELMSPQIRDLMYHRWAERPDRDPLGCRGKIGQKVMRDFHRAAEEVEQKAPTLLDVIHRN